LDEGDQLFVGQVPSSFSCAVGECPADGTGGRQACQLVEQAATFVQQRELRVRVSRQTLPDQVWRVKASQVWISSGEAGWLTRRTWWLIRAVNEVTGEVKFFVSNAPADADLVLLVRVAFRRFPVEHVFRIGKDELGLDHYEGRDWTGFYRHLILCQ